MQNRVSLSFMLSVATRGAITTTMTTIVTFGRWQALEIIKYLFCDPESDIGVIKKREITVNENVWLQRLWRIISKCDLVVIQKAERESGKWSNTHGKSEKYVILKEGNTSLPTDIKNILNERVQMWVGCDLPTDMYNTLSDRFQMWVVSDLQNRSETYVI